MMGHGDPHERNDITTLEQLRRFLEGTEALALHIADKDERYAWIERTLRRLRYRALGKADRSLVLRYLEGVSGYSRQVTRQGALARRAGSGGRHPSLSNAAAFDREDERGS